MLNMYFKLCTYHWNNKGYVYTTVSLSQVIATQNVATQSQSWSCMSSSTARVILGLI